MMSFIELVLVTVVGVLSIGGSYQKVSTGNQRLPLILTPMIEAGNIEKAQEDCKNKPFKDNIISYSGFFTVNETYNSNIFFWFFPALQNSESAPVLLFLEGGPGASSLYPLFLVNGPFSIKKNLNLKLREHNWINSQSVIFMDSPVGTGFSFTDEGGYLTNEIEIGRNLYTAILQFFMLFPQFQKNDFFVTGESYAGKYVPAVSYVIYTENPFSKLKINLKGLVIGNGLYDLEHMINYGDYLFQIGLLDKNGRNIFHENEKDIVSYIQQERFEEAFSVYDQLIFGEFVSTTIFQNLTGFTYLYNYLYSEDYRDEHLLGEYLSLQKVHKNLHVGNTSFSLRSKTVFRHLISDFAQSVKHWIEVLIEKYRILIYIGQLDLLFPFSLVEQFLVSLDWSGGRQYQTAPRTLWYVGDDLAGYSKVANNLTVVLVRNAGHNVPTDQPKWAEDLITKFTRNIPI